MGLAGGMAGIGKMSGIGERTSGRYLDEKSREAEQGRKTQAEIDKEKREEEQRQKERGEKSDAARAAKKTKKRKKVKKDAVKNMGADVLKDKEPDVFEETDKMDTPVGEAADITEEQAKKMTIPEDVPQEKVDYDIKQRAAKATGEAQPIDIDEVEADIDTTPPPTEEEEDDYDVLSAEAEAPGAIDMAQRAAELGRTESQTAGIDAQTRSTIIRDAIAKVEAKYNIKLTRESTNKIMQQMELDELEAPFRRRDLAANAALKYATKEMYEMGAGGEDKGARKGLDTMIQQFREDAKAYGRSKEIAENPIRQEALEEASKWVASRLAVLGSPEEVLAELRNPDIIAKARIDFSIAEMMIVKLKGGGHGISDMGKDLRTLKLKMSRTTPGTAEHQAAAQEYLEARDAARSKGEPEEPTEPEAGNPINAGDKMFYSTLDD